MRNLLKDSTSQVIVFRMTDSDGTDTTGLTVSVQLCKNGGSFASGAGSVAEVGNGLYKYTTGTNDLNTYGPIVFRATAVGAEPAMIEHQVVYDGPYTQKVVEVDAFDGSLDLNSTMKASVNAEADTALSGVGLTTTITGRIDAAVSTRLATSAITLNTGKVTVYNTSDCKADISLLALEATAQSILADTNELQTNQGNWLTATGFSTFNPATDTVAHVTLVDTTTTNTDMRGTDDAITSLDGIATTTNISALQTHGDETWPTATGFSTLTAQQVWEHAARTLSAAGATAIKDGLALESTLTSVKAVTDLLSVDENGRVDVSKLNGVAEPLMQLVASLSMVDYDVTVQAGSTTTNIVTNLTSTNDRRYPGRLLIFTTGSSAGRVALVESYQGSTKTLVVSDLGVSPSEGDKLVIW